MILKLLTLLLCLHGVKLLNIELRNGANTHVLQIVVNGSDVTLEITDNDGNIKQTALLSQHTTLQNPEYCDEPNCISFSNPSVTLKAASNANSFNVTWSTLINGTSSIDLQDCFDLEKTKMHWFAGPESFNQIWPIEDLTLNNRISMPQEDNFEAITEGYWLNSRGIYIYIHDKVPLFYDLNHEKEGYVCFSARIADPYRERDELRLSYTIGTFDNPKDAHIHAVEALLGLPDGHPNMAIIENPIWSTWARYYKEINDDVIIKFAQEIADHGYTGQFEIDDDWEKCYGALEFIDTKFSKIKETIKQIKSLNFRTSLWVHPFVNVDCTEFAEIATKNNYLVKNRANSTLTSWWNTQKDEAHHVDFTNKDAVAWFNRRLDALQTDIGIDTFKFDAGESSWTPQPAQYPTIPLIDSPQGLTAAYVENCATYGDAIEVRTGWRTQHLPVFVRMIDKDSHWSISNGIKTLVTTLLQMNLNGYTNVLPDMVGGNGYNGIKPDAELFVRWLQANTFMPTIQFSFVPWDYENHTDFNVVEISKKFVQLHQKYAPKIREVMERNTKEVHPVNGPIWWVDPENPDAYNISTQYLLGEDIVVAPILDQGQTSRDIFIPKGTWIDGNSDKEFVGPQTIKDYPAPIDTLPYFIRK